MESQVTQELRAFIGANYLFGDSARMPSDDASLVETGVLDSTGVLELIEFLEEHYDIQVAESETVLDNLGSIANLTRFVQAKTSLSSAGTAMAAPAVPFD